MLVRKDRIKNSYSVLDNLDNIFISEDLTQAYIYAKKALENASTIPAVLDTHGWNSVKSDRFEDGLVWFRYAKLILLSQMPLPFAFILLIPSSN
jgi:hypothetical protein